MSTKKHLLIGAALGGAMLIAGCQSSGPPSNVPAEYFTGTTLDRNAIGVTQRTEYLEVQLDERDTQLRVAELMKVRAFLDAYTDVGHGPLIVSMPKHADNPQLAVGAVAEVRQLAWEAGVDYDHLLGAAYDASGRSSTPIVMAYKTYQAVAPKCKSLAEIDVSNAISNSDLPSLGCAVRTNMAAMIAEPADLLGARDLDEGDLTRRSRQLELWRAGETTAAARSEAESAVVSNAVN
ncbi:MAG: CpaD family pilus assembly lipoprotein [Pseudomonadota bacterium]|nr:CpaD family pilus assembly lipoprotein [Pseudomonadota bacterium]